MGLFLKDLKTINYSFKMPTLAHVATKGVLSDEASEVMQKVSPQIHASPQSSGSSSFQQMSDSSPAPSDESSNDTSVAVILSRNLSVCPGALVLGTDHGAIACHETLFVALAEPSPSTRPHGALSRAKGGRLVGHGVFVFLKIYFLAPILAGDAGTCLQGAPQAQFMFLGRGVIRPCEALVAMDMCAVTVVLIQHSIMAISVWVRDPGNPMPRWISQVDQDQNAA
ncbi:hypothetical protein JHW43_001184 [Diplocarpon mali]|nr:hypothetical protein JHW43_001184 [Diplocarpon mali]